MLFHTATSLLFSRQRWSTGVLCTLQYLLLFILPPLTGHVSEVVVADVSVGSGSSLIVFPLFDLRGGWGRWWRGRRQTHKESFCEY